MPKPLHYFVSSWEQAALKGGRNKALEAGRVDGKVPRKEVALHHHAITRRQLRIGLENPTLRHLTLPPRGRKAQTVVCRKGLRLVRRDIDVEIAPLNAVATDDERTVVVTNAKSRLAHGLKQGEIRVIRILPGQDRANEAPMRRNRNFFNLPGCHTFALALQGLHGLNLPQQRTGMSNRGAKALNRAAEKTIITDDTLAGAPLKRGERL